MTVDESVMADSSLRRVKVAAVLAAATLHTEVSDVQCPSLLAACSHLADQVLGEEGTRREYARDDRDWRAPMAA